jgi:transketolase|tara:strand:- start:223 stop:1113 length:891 start_codon:yes stop_codon:yes gene_type:complete
MRKIFIDELILAAKKNKKIILIVNDLGYSVVEKFATLFPKQFYNAGVAEQNMMGLASGMALEGYHVFVYSIGNFPTFRCAEQIRNDVDYHRLPVTIVNVGAGVSYGNLGYSHHSIQDYALVRLFPNMLIAAPGDQKEIKACMQYIVKNPQPSYLRLAKSKNLILHDKISNLRPGKWLSILEKKNSKKTFLTTGNISYIAKNFLLKKKFNNYSLFSLPIWGMKFKEKQKEQIKKWEHVVVLEDHLEDGGFGSWIKESINNTNIKTKITSKHIDKKVIGKVGSEKYLLNNFYLKSFEK